MKFELYELYFWIEFYKRTMKRNKVHKVQKVKMLYYANTLRQKVTTLSNVHVPQSRTMLSAPQQSCGLLTLLNKQATVMLTLNGLQTWTDAGNKTTFELLSAF